MALEILGVMVILGVALIVVTVRLAFGENHALFRDPDDVRRAIQAGGSRDAVEEAMVLISKGQTVALAILNTNCREIMIAKVLGSKTVVRPVTRSDIRRLELTDDRITLRLRDFAMAKVEFEFDDEAQRNTARRELEALM